MNIFKLLFNNIQGLCSEVFWNRPNKLHSHAQILFLVRDVDYGQVINDKYYGQVIDGYIDTNLHCSDSFAIFTSWTRSFSEKKRYRRSTAFRLLFTREFIKYFFVTLSISQARINSWKSIYKIMKCDSIVGIQPNYYQCIAAKKLKIKVFDLQHSIISQSKSYYDFVFDSTSDKYLDGIIAIYASTYHWLRDKVGYQNVRLVKNPLVQAYPRPNKTNYGIYNRDRKNYIIFTQQYAFGEKWGNDCIDGAWTYHGLPLGFLDAIEHQSQITCIIKLHPLETRSEDIVKYIQDNYSSDKFIVASKDQPLQSLLHVCSAHFTYFSTSVLDAASIGIKSFIFTSSCEVEEWFYGLKQSGLLSHVRNDSTDVLRLLNNLSK